MSRFLPRRLPRPRLHGRRVAGLSLLEMLLVVALIAVVGLITASGMRGGIDGMRLRNAGKDIANQLRMVRAQAIARGEPQRFVIEPARRRWEGANQRVGEVPPQLQVQPWVEPRAGNQAQTQAPGMPWLAELQLQVRWGDSEREQLRWRSLRLLPPDLENAR